MRRNLLRAGLVILTLALLGLGLAGLARVEVQAPPMEDSKADPSPLADQEIDAVAQAVAAAWRSEPVDSATLPARLQDPSQGVYIGARRAGHLVTEAWGPEGGTVWESIRAALHQIRADVPASPPDTFQLDLIHSVRLHSYPEERDWLLTNLFRGVRGLAVQTQSGTYRLSPSAAIARNQASGSFIDEAIPFPAWLGGGSDKTRARQRYASFGADQLLIRLRPEVQGLRMERGNQRVRTKDVTPQALSRTVTLQAGWLKNTQLTSGALTYLYLPSLEQRASGKENMIRRWMASAALVRWAHHTGEEADWDAATRSIEYSLEAHYEEEDGLGVVTWKGKVKLGALAIAAYSLHTHRDASRWSHQEQALQRTIESLVDEDGSMRSWFTHPDENAADLNNFYPGEALFYWAQLIADGDHPDLLDRYMRSFRYYRAWHMDEANRNPAFIPWHTQAHFQVWQKTKDPELAAFILEMNDWLIKIQQWDEAPFPDSRGRFYAPGTGFGVPHASATGVYMEGLVDAYRLAVALGDAERAETYRVALLRGARSIMQLQFVDEVDTFYLENPQMALGGVRSRVWDNEIRCDNVQHPMMAILKMLEHIPAEKLSLVPPPPGTPE
jgi:hypothetical protein